MPESVVKKASGGSMKLTIDDPYMRLARIYDGDKLLENVTFADDSTGKVIMVYPETHTYLEYRSDNLRIVIGTSEEKDAKIFYETRKG